MKMQAADYAWVVFATIILAVLVAGWRINGSEADLLTTARPAAKACKITHGSCEKATRVARTDD